MPPLASSLVDAQSVALLRQWIQSLAGCQQLPVAVNGRSVLSADGNSGRTMSFMAELSGVCGPAERA